jgi:phage terminase small subunit
VTAKSLVAVADVVIPPLPMESAHPLTVQHWAELWSSPIAPELTQVDVPGLLIYISLVEDFFRAETVTARTDLSREIRLCRADFGLTPISRRRLQWEIAKVVEAEDRRVARDKAKPRPDPRLEER